MNKTRQLLLVAALVLVAMLLWLVLPSSGPGSESGAGRSGGAGGGRPPALVVLREVTEAVTNDRLSALATALARASVSVVPLSPGVLDAVLVDSGDTVARGDVLARLDDDEESIVRDRAARTLKDATTDLERLESLFASRTSTEVELDAARAAHDSARLDLRDARLRLSRRAIKAPIDGRIGIVPVDPGNYVTTQTPVATIDDRYELVLEFWVPERFAGVLQRGQRVSVKPSADPGRRMVGKVSAIGSRVDIDSRTLAVRARVDNRDDRLRPGMSFEVSMRFAGNTLAAVDPLAVQWDSSGAFVYRVLDGKAVREPIRIVERNAESVLVNAALEPGDAVVIEGILSLRPGADVQVMNAGPGGDGETPGGESADDKTDEPADQTSRTSP